MILSRSDPNYKYMPGIRSILGGIWIAGIYYFGANQYIIQKALGAKSLKEAQRGMAFAGYLKLIIPVLVVIPGIAAFVLNADIAKPDEAYPWLLDRFVPSGIKGFVFAALIAVRYRAGFSIYTGIYRFGKSGYYSHFPVRYFLEKDIRESCLDCSSNYHSGSSVFEMDLSDFAISG